MDICKSPSNKASKSAFFGPRNPSPSACQGSSRSFTNVGTPCFTGYRKLIDPSGYDVAGSAKKVAWSSLWPHYFNHPLIERFIKMSGRPYLPLTTPTIFAYPASSYERPRPDWLLEGRLTCIYRQGHYSPPSSSEPSDLQVPVLGLEVAEVFLRADCKVFHCRH